MKICLLINLLILILSQADNSTYSSFLNDTEPAIANTGNLSNLNTTSSSGVPLYLANLVELNDTAINVRNNSQIQVPRDLTVICIQLISSNNTTELASNQNNQTSQDFIKQLVQLGIPNSNIQTWNFSVDNINNTYIVTNTLEVTIDNLSLVPKVFELVSNTPNSLLTEVDYSLTLLLSDSQRNRLFSVGLMDLFSKTTILSRMGYNITSVKEPETIEQLSQFNLTNLFRNKQLQLDIDTIFSFEKEQTNLPVNDNFLFINTPLV
jgi:hypothetical protein